MKGTGSFPSSFTMTQDTQIQAVEKLIGPLLTDDIFLVSMKVKPTNNIKIYLDADGGLGIEKCIKINRALYKIMEEMGMYPDGDFSLEVSSPGLDEPLKLHRQYLKNIGRPVEILLNDDTKMEGKLMEVGELEIIIEFTEGKGKKAIVKKETIAFADIKQTKIQIKF
ncbi:MAG: ribosome assembly cofactor RimP [Sphingobacteriales bacterium]|nr:ribosome assembly cofactor RimP [Sphingobacteriales bacterium]